MTIIRIKPGRPRHVPRITLKQLVDYLFSGDETIAARIENARYVVITDLDGPEDLEDEGARP